MYNFYPKKLVQPPGCAPNLLLTMKLTILLTVVAIFQASAGSFAQKITLSERNTPLARVFDKISGQTGYDFLVSTDNLRNAKPVTIEVHQEELEDALNQVLAAQALDFIIQDRTIIITKKPVNTKNNSNNPIKTSTLIGRITDTTGLPLFGATVKNKTKSLVKIANETGVFSIFAEVGDEIEISFIGYKTYTFQLKSLEPGIQIALVKIDSNLNEVSIVSTGYQTLPKERATGAFVRIDSTLINRRVGTNILDRLDGVTSGLLFNKGLGTGNNASISIRGRSTIFANPDPLVVLDNFPYEGDLNNINPNDIANITILKDAAAASIWGVRAGNGVIVITTKKGRQNEQVRVTFNANTTVSSHPDLFYQPQISPGDYIDLEQFLFNKGYFDNTINDGYSTLSPAVSVMLQRRDGQISTADSAFQMNQLKGADIRNGLQRYIYRRSISQQYALSIDGGNKNQTYFISAGYDKNQLNTAGSSYERFTLNANNTYRLLKDKMGISVGLLIASSSNRSNSSAYTAPLYPYEQLADKNGNHLSVLQIPGLRKMYTDTAGAGKLLNWNYSPLDENRANSVSHMTDYKLNLNLNYSLIQGLDLGLYYQYQKGINDFDQLYDINSYYARNLINSFSQIDPYSGDVIRAVPLGGINNTNSNRYTSNYGRFQLNFATNIGNRQRLNVLAGAEIKDYQSSAVSGTLYGYDPSTASSLPVNYIDYLPQYYGSYNSATIPYLNSKTFAVDRTRSLFTNASYVLDDKYTLSASARRDESNIFGVSTNQKGVPLWSTGLLWAINKEGFYHFDLIPVLKMRATYGYNGNVDKTTSAYLTAQEGGANFWNTQYTNIVNPPNPSLRWEKDRNINFGIDFTTRHNLFSGSIDYYIKNGSDLIAYSPIAPQTGITQFRGNAADTRTNGIDIVINKNSISDQTFKWQSTLLFSYVKDIVTDYKVKQPSNSQIVLSNYANPLEGYPYNAIFSYPFSGLDKAGRPNGILNGKISQDYAGITRSTDPANLKYMGAATPLIFGSFRNTFSYKNLEVSLNIAYKFDYYFRRPNVFSGSNAFGSYGYKFADYDKRWQVPGDEFRTNVPALTYPLNTAQNAFYQGSEVLVEKADHIRLQDIRLSYNFRGEHSKPVLRNLQVYAYVNNVGILWKATKQPLDPDYLFSAFVNPKTVSLGLSTNF